MLFFITSLRALATCLITNAHYTGVYPIDLLACGGLLGDILFFAVSGYCLFDVKKSFPQWYGKRLVRVYLPVLLITAVYFLLGFYQFGEKQNALWWFIYPTGYHFVGSIVLLYIPFWFVGKFDWFRKRLVWIMAAVAVMYGVAYLCFYDKSYYHIDNVREWMIEFLFFESMLLGAWFRQKQKETSFEFRWWIAALTLVMCVIYFISKLFFSKFSAYSYLQIVNQWIIFALLYFVFRLFASLEDRLAKLPNALKKIVSFIAAITLEIYVVQIPLIDLLRPYLGFPLNWLAITASILVAAFILHVVCQLLLRGAQWIIEKCKERFQKNQVE